MIRILASWTIVLTCLSACSTNPKLIDLTLWKPIGHGNWITHNGVTESHAESITSFLVSTKSYSNYRLELEFFPTAEVNSGVFVACQNPLEPTPLDCHEINIWDNHPKQEYRTGAIVAKVFPPEVQLDTLDKWNHYAITVIDGSVEVLLNNVKTAQLQNSSLYSGYIALQRAEGGLIRFRNIRVTSL